MASSALTKWDRYKDAYGRQEIYWGLGIEEETYVQFVKPIYVATPVLRTAHSPERYSVRYFASYKPELLATALKTLYPDASGCIPLPLFLNAHAFQSMDLRGQHRTTYEKVPKPNPAFAGKSVFDEAKDMLQPTYMKEFMFDGDSIEFMTQKFYKTNVAQVVQELCTSKQVFLKSFNAWLAQRNLWREFGGCVTFPTENPPFVVHRTNPKHVSMFNNGTYHINITLPTWLGAKGEIVFPEIFREDHRRCMRLIQWIEPLLLVIYGTPDPLHASIPSKDRSPFSRVSQRAAMSRYIGIGTYNTNTMPEGKCNTVPIESAHGSDQEFWWYAQYHTTSAYVPPKEIGLDFNYRKHHAHGVEIRFLDWFPEIKLSELLITLICIAACSQQLPLAQDVGISESWHTCVKGVMEWGDTYTPQKEYWAALSKVFHTEAIPFDSSVKDGWLCLQSDVRKRYQTSSLAKRFLCAVNCRI